jgi:hypothetical protein
MRERTCHPYSDGRMRESGIASAKSGMSSTSMRSTSVAAQNGR